MDNANVGTYARRILKDTEDQRVQKRSEVQKIFIKYVRVRAGCRDAYALQLTGFLCINTKNLWKEYFFYMRDYSTQMEAARKGIITPELEIVAKEGTHDNRGTASAGTPPVRWRSVTK